MRVDKPLQMLTAKASMDNPTPMINISKNPIRPPCNKKDMTVERTDKSYCFHHIQIITTLHISVKHLLGYSHCLFF